MPIDAYTPQGHCPRCGAPIYIRTFSGGHDPTAIYTCECRNTVMDMSHQTPNVWAAWSESTHKCPHCGSTRILLSCEGGKIARCHCVACDVDWERPKKDKSEDDPAAPLHPIETKCAKCNSDRMTELRFHNKIMATFCRDCGEVVLR